MFTGKSTFRSFSGGQAHSSAVPFHLLWLLILGLVCSHGMGQEGASAVSKEYQLKAALLYTFAKYIEWPSTRFSSPDEPIVIGVMGKNPFGPELEKVVEGRKLNGRSFLVKPLFSMQEISSVHLLFVAAGGEPTAVGNTMDLIQAPEILTVGETEQFAALGGIITFVAAEDKVHYEVNRDAAKRGGVKISQQLLKMSSHGRKKI